MFPSEVWIISYKWIGIEVTHDGPYSLEASAIAEAARMAHHYASHEINVTIAVGRYTLAATNEVL